MAELVKMIRESDGHEADVHPDMVDDYKTGDYVVVKRARKADDPATPENEAYKPELKKRGRPKKNAG